MVEVLYQRSSSTDTCKISLERDLAALTHPLTEEERAEFIFNIKALITASNSDRIEFESVDQLEELLTTLRPQWTGWFGNCAMLEKVLDQAKRIEEHTQQITFYNGGLFYDFDPMGSKKTDTNPDKRSVDLYVNLGGQRPDVFFDGLVHCLTGLGVTQAHVPICFDSGVLSERETGIYSEDFNLLNRPNNLSRSIDSDSNFDFADIPFETFQTLSPVKLDSHDIVFIMSCLQAFDVSSVEDLLAAVFELSESEDNMATDVFLSSQREALLARFAYLHSLQTTFDLSCDDALVALKKTETLYKRTRTEMKDLAFVYALGHVYDTSFLYTDNRGRKQRDDEKIFEYTGLSVDYYYDDLANYYSNQQQTLKTLLPHIPEGPDKNLKAFELMLKYSYLNPEELTAVINGLASQSNNVYRELQALHGLSYLDLMTVIERANPDNPYITEHWHLPEAYHDYHEESRSQSFITHNNYADRIIEDYSLHHLSADVVSMVILAESEGLIDAKNAAGTHHGLMQVGLKAYQEITNRSISRQDLIRLVTGNEEGWQRNVLIGSRYLEWCMNWLNPTESLAIALGNYNWGCGHMVRYRLGHVYGIGDQSSLPEETISHITKYIVYNRMLNASDPNGLLAQN